MAKRKVTSKTSEPEPDPEFPPAFPFLLVPAGRLGSSPVAILPDSRIPAHQTGLAQWWKTLVQAQRDAGEKPPARGIQEALFDELFTEFESFWEVSELQLLILWTGNDACVVHKSPSYHLGEFIQEFRGCYITSGDYDIIEDGVFEAALIDDDTKAKRRWQIWERIVYQEWDGGSGGFNSVYRTAGGYWVDWLYECGQLLGPYTDLREALTEAGMDLPVEDFIFDLYVHPDFENHPDVLNALHALAQPPTRCVYYNRVPMRVGSDGVLRIVDEGEDEDEGGDLLV